MSPESEPKHKKMTRFLCQELLYEYAAGMLDKNRTRDMEEFLPTCFESQRELENLKKGMAYAKAVNSIEVSPSLTAGLEGFEPAWKKRLQSWSLWSFQRGWRMLPYTFLVVATGMGIYVTKPWKKDLRRDLILAQQERKEVTDPEGQLASPQVAKATELAAQPTEPSPVVHNSVMPVETKSEGEIPPPPPTTAAVEKPVPPVPAAPAQPPVPISAIPVTAPAVHFTYTTPVNTFVLLPPAVPNFLKAPSKIGVVAPLPETAAVAANAEPVLDLSNEFSLKEPGKRKAEEAQDNDMKKDLGPGSGKGSILRGSIEVDAFDSAWPAIRDKIITLGGKAAGNVELGWLRRPDESYFHFTLPESNQSELETFLKTFGPVRISKERHPRVMPEGQIRIILTVKDGGPHESDEAEAP